MILYGGPGFLATFLDNADKQRIFDDDMLPRLKAGDFDGALLVALAAGGRRGDPRARPALERARQINAVAGLVVAPLVARPAHRQRRPGRGCATAAIRSTSTTRRSTWPARPRR